MRTRGVAKAVAPLAALCALAACGHPRRVAIPASPAQESEEFSVDLEYGSGVWISVGQPSYVAVFRVRAGAGAVVFWPYEGESQRISAGRIRIPRWTLDQEHSYIDRSYFAFGQGRVTQRQFLLVVASVRPLPLTPYFDDPLLMEDELEDAYYGEGPLVEGILDLMIADRDAGGWGWACIGEDAGVTVPAPPLGWARRRSWIRANRLRDELACPAREGG